MSKDSGQTAKPPKQFRLTHLGNLNQVIKALGKTIRAMADDSLDSQKGARICAGLGILRGCLEIKELQAQDKHAELTVCIRRFDDSDADAPYREHEDPKISRAWRELARELQATRH